MKKLTLLMPSCKSDFDEYAKDFLESIKDHSLSAFSNIYVLAQGYSEDEVNQLSKIIPESSGVSVTIESGEKGQFGSTISDIRQYMKDHAPLSDYYMVVDDDMIHYEGAGEYIRDCLDVLDSRSDAVIACMTKSWRRKADDNPPYIDVNSWNNIDMLNGILVKHSYFIDEFNYNSEMIIGEDVSMFIEAFLSGHASLKFYNAPMLHIRNDKPAGLTNYYRSNVAEFMSNSETSLTKYKSKGLIKMRPKIFTESAIIMHKSNYQSNYGKYPEYLGKYDVNLEGSTNEA